MVYLASENCLFSDSSVECLKTVDAFLYCGKDTRSLQKVKILSNVNFCLALFQYGFMIFSNVGYRVEFFSFSKERRNA